MASASPARLPPRDLLLVLSVVALWGFNFVPIRWALDEVPPLALASLRFVIASIPMAFFVRKPEAPAWTVILYGLAIGVGQFGLLFLGIALGMPAGLASLVMQAQVFFTIGLAAFLLNDRVQPRQIIGTTVAASGLVILAWSLSASGATATLIGFALCIAAALSWAVGNIAAKHAAGDADAPPLDMFSLVVWSSLAAPIPLAALSFAFERNAAPVQAILTMSFRAWASVIFMAGGATLFGFAAWNRLLHRHPTASIAPFALLIPIAGIASAWLFLGEALTWIEGIAGALVLGGLGVNVISSNHQSRGTPESSRK